MVEPRWLGTRLDRDKLRALVRAEAEAAGMPADIADAVAHVESGYDPAVVGTVGEIGLMQVRPTTASMLGFSGPDSELAKPQVNATIGVAYLARAWRLANGDLCQALMKYRAGHGETRMTDRSVLYCWRARNYLRSIGSPFGGAVVPREDQIASIIAAERSAGPSRYWMALRFAFMLRTETGNPAPAASNALSFSPAASLASRSTAPLLSKTNSTAPKRVGRKWSMLRDAFAQREAGKPAIK
jgi:hypothetical protein